MQPMGSLQLAPKGLRCNGSGGLYGGNLGIYTDPISPATLFDFFTGNLADGTPLGQVEQMVSSLFLMRR